VRCKNRTGEKSIERKMKFASKRHLLVFLVFYCAVAAFAVASEDSITIEDLERELEDSILGDLVNIPINDDGEHAVEKREYGSHQLPPRPTPHYQEYAQAQQEQHYGQQQRHQPYPHQQRDGGGAHYGGEIQVPKWITVAIALGDNLDFQWGRRGADLGRQV
jgi:hypothetical protein